MAEVVDGADALRRAARERLRSGAHAIKIMASGGVISPSDPLRVPQYSPEEIRVVTEEAARRGSYVAAHAYSAEAIQVAGDGMCHSRVAWRRRMRPCARTTSRAWSGSG